MIIIIIRISRWVLASASWVVASASASASWVVASASASASWVVASASASWVVASASASWGSGLVNIPGIIIECTAFSFLVLFLFVSEKKLFIL